MATEILDLVKGMTDRMGKMESAMQRLTAPKSASKLSPEEVFHLMSASKSHSLIGTDGGDLFGGRGLINPLTRGVGMGQALRTIGEIAMGKAPPSAVEALERDHGFMTMERMRTEGMKQLDGTVRKAALAEGSGITGGYVVPPVFVNKLLELAIEDAFIRPRATVVPMTSRTITLPSLDVTSVPAAGTTQFLGGIAASWQPEAATINESEPTFRQTELTAWDLMFYTLASNQLLADNAVALDSVLTQLFSKAIVWYTEYAFLRGLGAGSSMPQGMLNAPAAIGVSRNAGSHFRLIDAATMLSKLLVESWGKAIWVMHQSVLVDLIMMKDVDTAATALAAGSRSVWLNPSPQTPGGPAANAPPMTFFGLPVFFTEKVPKLGTAGDVMLLDCSKYLIGDRMDLQLDVSPHVKFLNNQMVWRVIARLDGKPWLNNAVTLADGSATFTVSPFIYLN